jgi:multiple sugar transport system ATP-binding protein
MTKDPDRNKAMQVRFEGVTKRFGSTVILHEIDLEVQAGECVVLLGPSGCGKTTLLRLLAGLESADAGRISVGGRVVNDVAPADRDVAMVFQNYALYPHMTVFENIAFPLVTRGIAKQEIDRRVQDVAARLGLSTCVNRRPAQLSGGQQQRVALARAIVRSPAVYLMDEPLSNLDAQLRVQTRAELKRLQQELRTTTIHVTHDQAEAMTLGDRVAILRAGRIEQLGAPLDLYRRPANTFVARFIGSPAINLWPAEVGPDGNVTVLGTAVSGTPGRPPAGRIQFGIRPEDIRIALAPGLDSIEGRVDVVESVGNESIVSVTVAGERLVARAEADFAAAPGQPVWSTLAGERALLFDTQTGARHGSDTPL